MTTEKGLSLQEITAKAAAMAQEVPEPLRVAAFNKVFEALLAENMPREPAKADLSSGHFRRTRAPEGAGDDRVKELLGVLDSTAHPEILRATLALDAALLVLQAAQKSANIEWLGPSEISRVLKEKFRLPFENGAIRMALSRATDLVDSRTQGHGFEYRLMAPGEKYLANGSRHAAPRRKPRNTESKEPDPVPPSSASHNAPKARSPSKRIESKGGSAGRPGPLGLMQVLIADGYFDQPRTIGDIIEHVSSTKAHRYKTTDLSPTLVRLVRSEKLTRDKNSNDQFQYTKRP